MAFLRNNHGKIACDDIGGTFKREDSNASLRATTSGHILKNVCYVVMMRIGWWEVSEIFHLKTRMSYCIYAYEKSLQEPLLANTGRHMLGTSATHNCTNKSSNYEKIRKSISTFSLWKTFSRF